MQLQEQDKPAFKQWLLPKLSTISDAEPVVLAEYVVELFSTTGSKAEIKRSSVEQLSDFLDDHTQAFVDEVATAIEQKSWIKNGATDRKKQNEGKAKAKESLRPVQPSSTPPNAPRALNASSSTLAPDAPEFRPRSQALAEPLTGGQAESPGDDAHIPKGPRADRTNGARPPQPFSKSTQNGRQKQSRKRKLHDRETSQSRNSGSEHTADNTGERPYKQVARRGGGNAAEFRVGAMPLAAVRQDVSSISTPVTSNQFTGHRSLPHPPPSLASFPSLDALNPLGFFSAMMGMGMGMPGGTLPSQAFGALPTNVAQLGRSVANIRCPDYETKGICLMGTLCPYEHGEGIVVPAIPEYDPNHSSLAMQSRMRGRQTSSNRNDGKFPATQRRERARAPFSQAGPSQNLLDETVVVEQIPEDHFTEQQVHKFFSQFGTIIDIQMQAYKRLAIIKFSDHTAASRAYDSPKVIFDNRFVKVYWHKPEHLLQSNGANGVAAGSLTKNTPEIYHEDEVMIDMEEFRKQQAELQKEFEEKRRKAEEATARSNMLNMQLQAKEEELSKLRSKVLEKARAKGVDAINRREQQAASNGSSRTDDLAKLQAEAAGLFANAGSDSTLTVGQGGFNSGRESLSRGGYRGRGGRGGVIRLDNRPRRLAVAGIRAGSEKERALKQYLLNANGCNSVEPHAQRADTLLVGFDQRYQAEVFLQESTRIPNVGDLMLLWVPNDASIVQPLTEHEPTMLYRDTDDETSVNDGQVEPKAEVDLDVADDTDQWL
ncbi:hypothetical protein N0V90_011539 [Kalmusia sp. IMI 367209]|nr:hypothetical protein N0V90_011539 [Kalmusia sp. IMI 367209]